MNKKRIVSFVLSLSMILSIIQVYTVRVEAAVGDISYNVSTGNANFKLPASAINYIRSDEIPGDSGKIYAKWNNNYSNMRNTRLDLTFHIQDGYTYILSVENAKKEDIGDTDVWNTPVLAEILKVTLKTIDDMTDTSSYLNLTGLKLFDPKTQSDLTLTPQIVTGDRRFKFDTAETAAPASTAAVFLMKASTGFSLTDDLNNKISFYWDADKVFTVVVDKTGGLPSDGKIFDFTLEGDDIGVNSPNPDTNAFATTTQYACSGYDDAITAIPFAEDDDDNPIYPGYHLDTKAYPNSPEPGVDTGVMLDVNYPTFWDKNTKRFVQKTSESGNLRFSMQLNLTDSDFVTVSNIYADAAAGFYTANPSTSDYTAEKGTSNNRDCITFKFPGLEPSTVFNGAYIQISYREDQKVLLNPSRFDLTSKSIFTYPKYKIAADGTDDFYMEITPFKYSNGRYISGNYTIYEINNEEPLLQDDDFYDYSSFSGDQYKLETRYYKAGDSIPRITLDKNAKASNSTWCWYFITFETETSPKKHYNSQFYNYKSDESDVKLGTPEIVEPISSKVVSALGDSNELLLTMDWKIGMLTVLNNAFDMLGTEYVDYVFKKGYKSEKETGIDDPLNNEDFRPFAALRITKTTKSEQNPSGYIISLAEDYVKHPYNKGLMFTSDPNKSVYTKSMIVSGKSYDNAYGHVEIKLPIYQIDSTGKPLDAFYFPDTCLIEAYATYETVDKSVTPPRTDTEYTGVSVRKIITINALDTMEVPAPQSFRATTGSVTRTSFQLAWLPVNTSDYEQVEITPKQMVLLNKYPDAKYPDSVTYNMYVSTSKENMTTLADFFKSDTTLKTTAFYGDKSTLAKELQDFLPKIIRADATATPIASTSVLNFANTETEIPVTVTSGSTKQPGRNVLRDENILLIPNISQVDIEFVVNLAGLDTNQVYYVMLETQVQPYKQKYDDTKNPPLAMVDENNLPVIIKDTEADANYPETDIIEERTGFSKYSVLITVTTTPDGESPDPSEIPPPSPTGVDKKGVTGNSATVFWNRKTELSNKDYNGLKYQVLRIRGDQLTTAQVNSNIAADKFIAQLDTKLEPTIWQTRGESNILTFSVTDFTLYDGGTTPSYEYVTTEKFHEFTDRSLKPNQLYMYYVRAVTLVPDADKPDEYTDDIYSHSVWVPISVTTDPVHSPINLRVEQEKVVNPKTSTVISFDAPITKDKLGSSNYFGISITEEGTELPERIINSTADINALYASAAESAEEGHTHFEYTITGLKPGKSYIIKIRMYDITLGDWSPYSNTARTRTEVDDEDYDFNSDLDKWTKHYISKIEAILKKPIWQISDPTTSTTAFSAEIRTSAFDSELQRSTDGVVLLGQKGNVTQSYYIPLTAIQKANNAQKGFLISFGDQEIVIQKSTFDTATSKEIQNALKLTTNADIFIKIDASISQYTTPVDGTTPVSPSITVTYSVIGTKTTEKQWDKDIYAQLDAYVKNPSMLSVFNSQLTQQLNAKATDEQLVKFVDQQVTNVAQTLITMARNSFNSIINSSYVIGATDKPFIVKSTVDDTAATGGYYYQGGLWLKQEQVSQYGSKSGIINNLAGMYIFAGNKVVTPDINGLQNVAELSGIYAKYGLNDYLGTDSVQINASNASVGTVAGVTARVMGAAKTEDPIDYLKSKGYHIPVSNKTANIQAQQAIYLLMALYEQKTNTKIDTLKIKNYNATANITGIDPKYNKSILAAIELGVIDSGSLQPRQAILTSDYIKMLSQLAKKVKL